MFSKILHKFYCLILENILEITVYIRYHQNLLRALHMRYEKGQKAGCPIFMKSIDVHKFYAKIGLYIYIYISL